MTLVIDASVALKWVIDEDDSEAAQELVSDHALAAPELLLIECANVLWTRSVAARCRESSRATR